MTKSVDPFLNPIFRKDVNSVITEGWLYSADEFKMHGVKVHRAVDFAVPTGTPVLAAADGIAVASFEESPVLDSGGVQRMWKGQPIYYGFGLVVQILHPNGWFTYYSHLHKLIDDFEDVGAYLAPTDKDNELNTRNIAKEPSRYKSEIKTINVKAGQVIGYSGITGMGWGTRTYDNWIKGLKYEVCDEEHVHFQLAKYRKPADSNQSHLSSVDSFGIYGTYDRYPISGEDWSSLKDSKWL